MDEEIKALISEMQEVRQEYTSLSIDQVLRLFQIKSSLDLTNAIKNIGVRR